MADVLKQECLHLRVWNEDDGYIAECLDIPGCVSQGNTRDEALANVQDAIAMCLDVIREDAALKGTPSKFQIEVLKLPIRDFLKV